MWDVAHIVQIILAQVTPHLLVAICEEVWDEFRTKFAHFEVFFDDFEHSGYWPADVRSDFLKSLAPVSLEAVLDVLQ